VIAALRNRVRASVPRLNHLVFLFPSSSRHEKSLTLSRTRAVTAQNLFLQPSSMHAHWRSISFFMIDRTASCSPACVHSTRVSLMKAKLQRNYDFAHTFAEARRERANRLSKLREPDVGKQRTVSRVFPSFARPPFSLSKKSIHIRKYAIITPLAIRRYFSPINSCGFDHEKTGLPEHTFLVSPRRLSKVGKQKRKNKGKIESIIRAHKCRAKAVLARGEGAFKKLISSRLSGMNLYNACNSFSLLLIRLQILKLREEYF